MIHGAALKARVFWMILFLVPIVFSCNKKTECEECEENLQKCFDNCHANYPNPTTAQFVFLSACIDNCGNCESICPEDNTPTYEEIYSACLPPCNATFSLLYCWDFCCQTACDSLASLGLEDYTECINRCD